MIVVCSDDIVSSCVHSIATKTNTFEGAEGPLGFGWMDVRKNQVHGPTYRYRAVIAAANERWYGTVRCISPNCKASPCPKGHFLHGDWTGSDWGHNGRPDEKSGV